jgi:hypothetical protein
MFSRSVMRWQRPDGEAAALSSCGADRFVYEFSARSTNSKFVHPGIVDSAISRSHIGSNNNT